MTPFEQAAEWHREHGGEMELSEVVEAHAQGGYVFITPQVFLLVRRVDLRWTEDIFSDPWRTVPAGDCWHVWLVAGDWTRWEELCPYDLPYVTMHRRGELRVYSLRRFRRLKWRALCGRGDAAGHGQQGAETERPPTPGSGADDGAGG